MMEQSGVHSPVVPGSSGAHLAFDSMHKLVSFHTALACLAVGSPKDQGRLWDCRLPLLKSIETEGRG